MSTTDIYPEFQKWWSETGHHAVWQNNEEDSAWQVWQAATEAAKATGTEGGLPELPEPTASSPHGVHLYSLDKMLAFAHAAIHKRWCAEVNCDAVREELVELKAARQPAPVVNPEVLKEQASVALIQRRKIQDLQKTVTELRAALAATAAPVLSDERIDWLANCACPGGVAYPSQVKAAIRDALREAATRSQP